MGPRTPRGTGTHLHRQVWLKRSPRSLSPTMSRPSCCGSSLPTPPVVAMGQEMLPLQLQPPTATSRLCTRRSSPRQESLLRFLRCSEVQEILFAAQQLQDDASAWWANYTATHPAGYQVSCAKFREAFRTHYIHAGVMRKKHQEFMDLKQGGRSVHDYYKQFNHLA
jgi:hypothetical protein